MTEADILSVRNELTAIIVSIASFSFAMISAYIVGLWLFLKDAPFSLRALAFVLLTSGLAFMGVVTVGVNGMMLGTERAWSKLVKPATELPGFGNAQPDYLAGFTIYEAAAVLGGAVFLAIYLSLFYLTFFYRWPDGMSRIYR